MGMISVSYQIVQLLKDEINCELNSNTISIECLSLEWLRTECHNIETNENKVTIEQSLRYCVSVNTAMSKLNGMNNKLAECYVECFLEQENCDS